MGRLLSKFNVLYLARTLPFIAEHVASCVHNNKIGLFRVNGPITVTDPVVGTVLKYRYFVKLFESHY